MSSLLTAYIAFGTLVAFTVYMGMIVGAGPINIKEYFALIAFALACGAIWPVTSLVCVWGETHH